MREATWMFFPYWFPPGGEILEIKPWDRSWKGPPFSHFYSIPIQVNKCNETLTNKSDYYLDGIMHIAHREKKIEHQGMDFFGKVKKSIHSFFPTHVTFDYFMAEILWYPVPSQVQCVHNSPHESKINCGVSVQIDIGRIIL